MTSAYLQYRIYKIYVSVSFAAVLLSVPLAFALPVELSFENGLIENAQVVTLLGAAVVVLNVRAKNPQMKWLQRFFAAGLVLMALRELSWGRVFFPVGMEDSGAVFVDMAHYKYRVPVHIFIAVYSAAMLFMLIRFVPVRKILSGRQPLAVFAVLLLSMIFSYVGDHGWLIGKACGQILEELNELIFYATLPAVDLYYQGVS